MPSSPSHSPRLTALAALFVLSSAIAFACARSVQPRTDFTPADSSLTAAPTGAGSEVGDDAPIAVKKPLPAVPAASAPRPDERLTPDAKAAEIATKIDAHFDRHPGRRVHVQVDKPLYQPGETVWVKSWSLRARNFAEESIELPARYELVNPRGTVVAKLTVRERDGISHNAFDLPADLDGGEYIVRVHALGGVVGERPIVINSYDPPRLKQTLEFLRKAYGEGDEVTATFELKRATGEPLPRHRVTGVVRVDGEELPRFSMTTDGKGELLVRFVLPNRIHNGDGLLTLMVEDGGITESISRSIPIVLRRMQFSAYPEGGKLVAGLPTRVYFEAKTPLGKPADVEGRIVDDRGNSVATFSTFKNGLGRVDLSPATGRTYRARITKPAGISEEYALPIPENEGCVLTSFDDFDSQHAAVRVAVRCTDARTVTVVGMLRERVLDLATVAVPANRAAIVHLDPKDEALARAQGVVRVTVFDADRNPLAERLVFRNRRGGLQVSVDTDRPSYSPRDGVELRVTTRDADGKPVPAELALSVVDDTVISFADDKNGHILSRLLLEPELPGKVEEPNFYFDLTEEKSAVAMDLLMGTRGWRTFEWRPVFDPPPLREVFVATGLGGRGGGPPRRKQLRNFAADAADFAGNEEMLQRARAPRPMAAPPAAVAPVAMAKAEAAPGMDLPQRRVMPRPGLPPRPGRPVPPMQDVADEDEWAPVRVFPTPNYDNTPPAERTDFRETVFWSPVVRTDAKGTATVRFHLSDAITSFRVFAEGVGEAKGAGAGLVGRKEHVFRSNLPFSLGVKIPVEVSAGDRVLLPVTLSNERRNAMDVSLAAAFGALLRQTSDPGHVGTLPGGERRSLFFPLEVTGTRGEAEVRLRANGAGLDDEIVRQVTVVPVGFPQTVAHSGTTAKRGDEVKHAIDLGAATAGSITASVTVFPSPVSTLVAGFDGMFREPTGCFEQTSSANYPNVMVLRYLQKNDVADSALLTRTQGMLDRGYRRLVGYESENHGFEWFGGDPGHEALTAYGLVQFADMRDVYGSIDSAMVSRTAAWLRSRRDGQGGYQRNSKALDSFGRASPEVTNAYITHALASIGETDLKTELQVSAKLAATTQDPYLLAVTADTLLYRSEHVAVGRHAARRLARMQSSDGSWTGAKESITRSTGRNLLVETTAFAVLALMHAGDEHSQAVRRGVEWLQKARNGNGAWGATQATVLALKALTAYAKDSRSAPTSGAVTVLVNGKPVGEVRWEAGNREPVVLEGIGNALTPGANTIALVTQSGDPLPYTVSVEYRSVQPASSANAALELTTSMERNRLKMGETVRVEAVVKNRTSGGQPMSLARIGIPGGMSFQTWQLRELREKGLVAFYETRPREVILYFRDFKPNEVKRVPIELVATVPGHYTAPASSAYLYYTDDQRDWADALVATIDP